MHSHSRRHRSSRRFLRDKGVHIFIGFVVAGIVALVALLMYFLGTPVLSMH
jgi:hypothetical protein